MNERPDQTISMHASLLINHHCTLFVCIPFCIGGGVQKYTAHKTPIEPPCMMIIMTHEKPRRSFFAPRILPYAIRVARGEASKREEKKPTSQTDGRTPEPKDQEPTEGKEYAAFSCSHFLTYEGFMILMRDKAGPRPSKFFDQRIGRASQSRRRFPQPPRPHAM